MYILFNTQLSIYSIYYYSEYWKTDIYTFKYSFIFTYFTNFTTYPLIEYINDYKYQNILMLFNISKQHATEVIILCLCAIDMNSPQDAKQIRKTVRFLLY